MKTNFYQTGLIIVAYLAAINVAHAQWTKVSSDGAVDFVVHNNALYTASAKVFKTTDGITWAESSTGLTGGGTPNCVRAFDGILYAGGNGSSYYTSSDNGATWIKKDGRSGLSTVTTTGIYADGNNITYGTTGGGKWQYSTNSGTSWAGSNFPWGVSPGNIGPDIVKMGANIYSCGYDYVFKSADNGKNWDTTNKFGATNSLCVQGTTLFVAGYGSGVNKSTNGGETWTCVLGCNITDLTRSATRIISSGNNIFVAGALGKVHQSNDGGATWTNLSGDGTVLSSTEIITALAVFNNKLYVATGTGIYQRDFSGSSGLKEKLNIQASVFPNPASNNLNISLPQIAENIKVTLVNIQGKNILTQQFKHTAIAQVPVAHLDQGIYQLLVETEDGVTAKKFVKQ